MVTKRPKPDKKLKIQPSQALLSGEPCSFGDPKYREEAVKESRKKQGTAQRKELKDVLKDNRINPAENSREY